MDKEKITVPESPEGKLVFLREKYFGLYSSFYENLIRGQVHGRSTWTGNVEHLNLLSRFCEDLGLKEELEALATTMREKYPEWDGNFWQFANFGSGRPSGGMG